MISDTNKDNCNLNKNKIHFKLILLYFCGVILLIFPGCSLTLSSIVMIDNAKSPDYLSTTHSNSDKIKRNKKIRLFLVNGDSLTGKYIGFRNIESVNFRNEINVENKKKSNDSLGMLISYQDSQKLIPLSKIKEIQVENEKRRIWVGFLTGLILDTIFIMSFVLTSVDHGI